MSARAKDQERVWAAGERQKGGIGAGVGVHMLERRAKVKGERRHPCSIQPVVNTSLCLSPVTLSPTCPLGATEHKDNFRIYFRALGRAESLQFCTDLGSVLEVCLELRTQR